MARSLNRNLIVETGKSSTMGPSIQLQVWALIRRYFITLIHKPISSLIRSLVWPGTLIGITTWIIQSMTENDAYGKDINHAASLPWITSFITIFQLYHFTEWLVMDKSTGIKSLMISMGLKPTSYYLANSICFILFIMPIMVIVGCVYISYVMKDLAAAVMTVLILFVFQLLAWLFVIASLLTSVSYAFVATLLVLLDLFLHPGVLWLMKQSSEEWRPFVLFMVSFSPYESIRILCDTFKLCKDCESTKFDEKQGLVAQPIYLIIMAMTVWIFLLFALARWFDEICPWKEDTAVKKPFFCLERGESLLEDQNSQDASLLESKYFERPAGHREVGISVRNVTKRYGIKTVVNNISFNIFRGETTLLLGHNGAGKTTLMNIILNKLVPEKGRVSISQSNTISNHRGGVGVCPQTSVLDDNLSVKQHLELFAYIKTSGISSQELDQHIETTIEDVGLTSHLFKCPPELSGGMKRKLSLALAFVGKSQILILDEPSSGLDPDSRVSVWNVIRRYRSDRTVLLSTQHMEEADYLGDRIAIMNDGKIMCCGSSIFLNNIFGSGYKLRVECHASKQKQILSFVRKYFKAAKPSEVDQAQSPHSSSSKKDPIQDIVIELGDDKSQDPESQLIKMLEEIESHSHDLHIISHGLKSSSIEDVMLNTSKAFDQAPPESVKISFTATSGHINTLAKPQRASSKGAISDFRNFLYSFLAKHLQTYRNDWSTILVFRIGLVLGSAYSLVNNITNIGEQLNSDIIVLFMVAHFIYYPTFERNTKFKTMQMTSYASFLSYWISQYLIDLLTILFIAFSVNLFLLTTFNGKMLSSQFTVHSIATLAILLFGTSAAFLAYIMSNILTNHRASTGSNILFYMSGPALMSILFMINVFVPGKLTLAQDAVNYILITFMPTSALRYIFFGLQKNCYISPRISIAIYIPGELHQCDPGFWTPVSAGFMALLGQVLAYGAILYMIERSNIDLSVWFNWASIYNCVNKAPVISETHEIDQDVLDESAKVAAIIDNVPNETYSLVAADLGKSYRRGVKVVNHLSFSVNKSECFGLLGVNGAGKTTTFSMLVAETAPDEGRVWANGRYLSSNVDKYRQKIGFDPQESPDFNLTPTDALYLMARVRRVDELNIPMLISSILELLDMSEHANKNARKLSGGTKRKLSLGMSLIGNPLLLALDEPTAGIDPMARRGIWHLLRSLRMQNGASIVISSHAMEECEAICDRISIMARGRLRCIGSFLHLRSKFAQGCNVRIQFSATFGADGGGSTTELIDRVISELTHRFKSIFGSTKVKLADKNINSATFNILDNSVKRSSLLKILGEIRQKYPTMSYMINDSSLEDIFIKLAREQEEQQQQQQ